MKMGNTRKINTRIQAVLVMLMLIFSCITPAAASAAGSDSDENDICSIRVTADPDSGPYLAGSTRPKN